MLASTCLHGKDRRLEYFGVDEGDTKMCSLLERATGRSACPLKSLKEDVDINGVAWVSRAVVGALGRPCGGGGTLNARELHD